jgi:superfamily II DNA or RNA helicase
MNGETSISLPVNWKDHFNTKTLKRGAQYQRKGNVLSWEPDPDGDGITASVQGMSPEPYEVGVTWGMDEPDEVFFEGICSCPMEFNCKHVAAAMLAAESDLRNPPLVRKPARPPKAQLSAHLQEWLRQLRQAAAPPAAIEAENNDETERLVYVLSEEKAGYGGPALQRRLAVNLQVVRRLLNGGYGQGRTFYSEHLLNNYQPQPFVRPADIAIVRRLKLIQPPGNFYGASVLTGLESASLLEEILRTGRCHWRGTGKKHPPLSLGPARPAKPEWKANQQGMQSPSFAVSPPPTAILSLTPPWYLDETAFECGPLDTGLPPAVAHGWITAPTVTPDQAELLGEELTRRYPELQVPAPRRIEVETITDLKPTPCLRLFSARVKRQHYYGFYYGQNRNDEILELNLARVEFDYAGQRLSPGAPGVFIEQFLEGKLRRIKRREKSEMLEYAQLLSCGFAEAGQEYSGYQLGKNADALVLTEADGWFEFCQNMLPQLRENGWRVEIDDSFGFRLAEPEAWYADAEESSGMDWFGVEIGVQLDGQKVNLLPVLLQHLQSNPQLLSTEGLAALKEDAVIPIHLPEGRVLPFPARRLRGMLGVLLDLFNPQALDRKGRLQMSKLRAAELSDLAGDAEWRWMGGAGLRELSRKLRNFSGIQPVAPPPDLRATLRGYQQEGLNWLQFLRDYSLAGILADDMGLGKTVQALAHLARERASGRMDHPSLIVAPTSLMTNWRQEAERFTPGLKLLVLHGLDRKQHFEKMRDYDVIVTSYPLLPRDQAILLEQEFHCVILDEAQFIKNPKTQYAQIVCQLKARHRLCLTGTPMENHLGELWSLFNFLLPGFLGDEVRFRKVFRNPIEKGRSEERRKVLARRIAPFMLRRRKEEVVKELPPKTEIVQNVELAGAQRDLYETIRLAMHAKVRAEVANKGLSRAHIIILDALLKLRQVCCDPRLLKIDAAKKVKDSAKLELLMDLLPEMISEGRRILLFSQFTSMLTLIESELAKAGLNHVLLTGQTTDRATPIRRFQEGEVPLFLISLKAGGTGLNLTAADTVIHYDPWWNPAVENQATDRAHRIGQSKSVFVYKLMTTGTVEEKILQLQARKKELVEGLLNEERKDSVKLGQEDLDILFAPIG